MPPNNPSWSWMYNVEDVPPGRSRCENCDYYTQYLIHSKTGIPIGVGACCSVVGDLMKPPNALCTHVTWRCGDARREL